MKRRSRTAAVTDIAVAAAAAAARLVVLLACGFSLSSPSSPPLQALCFSRMGQMVGVCFTCSSEALRSGSSKAESGWGAGGYLEPTHSDVELMPRLLLPLNQSLEKYPAFPPGSPSICMSVFCTRLLDQLTQIKTCRKSGRT